MSLGRLGKKFLLPKYMFCFVKKIFIEPKSYLNR